MKIKKQATNNEKRTISQQKNKFDFESKIIQSEDTIPKRDYKSRGNSIKENFFNGLNTKIMQLHF